MVGKILLANTVYNAMAQMMFLGKNKWKEKTQTLF